MHCHVLPGVDDGPKTMDETEAVLKEAVRQGISTMIVTPHYHPDRYMVSSEQIGHALTSVRRMCAEKGIKITLLPGQECLWHADLVEALNTGSALTLNGTRYVLIEFMPWTIFRDIFDAVSVLGMNGYIPVIAHFERYECLFKRTDRLTELRNVGALLQLNFDRLLDKETLFRKNIWKRLLLDGYVDFLGSDTHGINFRPLHVEEALENVSMSVDLEILDQVLSHNIAKLKGI
jgi:protein-tyrosine phosphatase